MDIRMLLMKYNPISGKSELRNISKWESKVSKTMIYSS